MIKNLSLTCLLSILIFALASCVKNDPVVPATQTVSLNVVNASNLVVNYYINGARQNGVTGIFPLAISGYTPTPRGSQVFTFKQLFNNQNITNPDTLFTLPLSLDSVGSTVRYSVFVGGLSRGTAFSIRDTLVSDNKNAKLRFVVASPEVTGLRVFMNDTLIFTSTAFKSVSAFKAVGNGKKIIQICPPDSRTPLFSTTYSLNTDSSYTLFSAGNASNFRAGLVKSR